MKITLAQINPTVGAIEENAKKILQICNEVGDNTDLILFPEFALCGYPAEDLILRPAFIQKVADYTQKIAAEGHAIILSVPWQEEGKTYNAAHLIYDGKIQATTRKYHLPNTGVFDECRLFTQGELPKPVEFKGKKLGLMICEDMWHDDVAIHLKQQGAEILVVPNASPFTHQKNTQRISLAKNHVKNTGLPFYYCNQIGGQDELVFDGGSFIMDKNGAITHQAVFFEEDILTDTENRPPKATETLSHIYAALKLGIKDYISKNDFKGVLLGLSGGVDSALAAVLATDALGADRVNCVMLPSEFTSQDSLDDAAELAKNLGVKLDTISIQHPFETMKQTLAGYDSDITTQNLQSRLRGLILMALSNETGNMVLTTGNKSELAAGYATLYGDMVGGFNALKDIYKTQVYALCNWRNEQSPIIPARIIDKAPTAELKHDQTDQDTLPDYAELDAILENLIEHEKSHEDIIALGFAEETVKKVANMLRRSEYKRYQSAPGVKISIKAFGKDRRYPMTNNFKD